ncbi:endonuclease domain-containing protein [Pararhizobium sp. BT-229]|uniref:endonuclease domain-containing protein n=1 Tax=Pararhizobium sp. BT-229 TaxID=2986923 RepID=UPI0021F6F4C0|nr:endonuclease domain-containing protein [Pararhizobium sp. BT-229]MCV9961487.1 endonuclease domain-containing protein [Pararhizobium sp. BT-229]
MRIDMEHAPLASPPSSGPSGHLLPAGEKREVASTSAVTSSTPTEAMVRSEGRAASSLFSPAGRRWPEGPDEGGEATVQNLKPFTKRQPGKTNQARALRQNEQEAEYRLWGHLRNRLLNGHKFTRQIPLGPYIADFLCREKMLIVELDGSQHATSQSDPVRTRWLNDQGYSVIRFWNHEALQERRAVLDTILAVLNGQIRGSNDTIRLSLAAESGRATL